MAEVSEIAAYIQRKKLETPARFSPFNQFWERGELNFLWASGHDLQLPDPATEQIEALASELYEDAGFKALRLATFLNSPDGQLIAEAVGLVLPLGPDYDLWVAAMQRAAQMQYVEGSKPAARFALAASGAFLVLVLLAVAAKES
jgi:hypothetical protein